MTGVQTCALPIFAMLVHQGAKALEIWSGVPADRTAPVMAAAARAALGG